MTCSKARIVFLTSIKTRKDKLLRALAARREEIVGASRLLEEYPRISDVSIDLHDEDLESLNRREGKTETTSERLYFSVSRERVPIVEDPEHIQISINIHHRRSAPEKDKQLGQAIFTLPSPFVCVTWNGETVLPA
jgi:hypothetical protein